MAMLLSAIQFYPAVNKMIGDLTGYWTGADPAARERILQHKIDEARQQLADLKLLIERTCGQPRDQHSVGTQTEPTTCEYEEDCRSSPQIGLQLISQRYITSVPETPRELSAAATGM